MNTKHWFIAAKISCIFLLPLVVFFGIIPTGYYISIDHKTYLKEVVEPLLLGKWNNIFMFYSFLFGVIGLSIIIAATTLLIKDSDDLDNLEEAIYKYNQARLRLEQKIKNL